MQFRTLAFAWFTVCVTIPLLVQAQPQAGSTPARAHSQSISPAAPAPQVIFDATGVGSPLQLTTGWRVGITADPAASLPTFDDSSWAIRDAKSSIADVPELEAAPGPTAANGPGPETPPHRRGSRRFAWFRLHIKLAPHHERLALLIKLPISANTSFGFGATGPSPDIYANGIHIQPEGPHGDVPEHYQLISRIYNLDIPPDETSLVLAVRIHYIPFGYGAYNSFFSNRTLYLGSPSDLERELRLWQNRSLFERLPRLIYSILLAVLAVFLFAFYLAQKGHAEYLWLALHELVQAPIAFIELAGSSARLDTLWYAALFLQLILISAYLFYEFLVAFLALPRRWYIRVLRYSAPVLAFVGPTLLFVGHSTGVAILLVSVIFLSGLWLLAWSIFIFGTLIAAALKRNIEAGLLLIPLILTVIGFIEPIVASVISDETGVPFRSPLRFDAGPIPIHMYSLGDFAGILVIVLIIYFRFLRIQREQERATSELDAARSVQELLIPQEKLATPGFDVDSVYSPANEVGGDFFHVRTEGSDGLMVVIGDVAGKGLKAAMNVSFLMGALRRAHERSPAKILESLNTVLTGTESFTTCQAIWLGSNGEAVVANAGHLPPYLNSQEVNLPGDLPLGVLPQVAYQETHFYLHPGDRLLLLSDGVVEARQPSGELFGFDRVRYLSNQSAFYLADAAKSFGQQDDITVLSVRRQAQGLAA